MQHTKCLDDVAFGPWQPLAPLQRMERRPGRRLSASIGYTHPTARFACWGEAGWELREPCQDKTAAAYIVVSPSVYAPVMVRVQYNDSVYITGFKTFPA